MHLVTTSPARTMPADGDSTRESVRYGAARDPLPVLSLPVVDTKRSAARAGAVDARPASNIMVATASLDRRFMRRVQRMGVAAGAAR